VLVLSTNLKKRLKYVHFKKYKRGSCVVKLLVDVCCSRNVGLIHVNSINITAVYGFLVPVKPFI
jgi:hypothetical protein